MEPFTGQQIANLHTAEDALQTLLNRLKDAKKSANAARSEMQWLYENKMAGRNRITLKLGELQSYIASLTAMLTPIQTLDDNNYEPQP